MGILHIPDSHSYFPSYELPVHSFCLMLYWIFLFLIFYFSGIPFNIQDNNPIIRFKCGNSAINLSVSFTCGELHWKKSWILMWLNSSYFLLILYAFGSCFKKFSHSKVTKISFLLLILQLYFYSLFFNPSRIYFHTHGMSKRSAMNWIISPKIHTLKP